MARALVTGGAGFIGSHLVDRLRAGGHAVRVLDNLSTGTIRNLEAHADAVELIEGDIGDADLVEHAVEGMDWVFHLAALVSVPESVEHPRRVMEVNVRGTGLVAYAAMRVGVSRFLFASSCAVYGETGPDPVTEDAPTHPLSPYGASKLMGECLLNELHHSGRMPTLCCRFFNVFGQRQRADSPYSGVVAQFVSRARNNLPLTVYGDGAQTRDFVAVSDVVGLLAGAAERDAAGWPPVVNVGTGQAVTVRALADIVQSRVSNSSEIRFAEERRGDLRHSCADVSRASTQLDWQAHMSLSEGIRLLWDEAMPPTS